MKFFLVPYFFAIATCALNAKEWNSLSVYQSTTGKTELSVSDWLRKDRVRNTAIWQNANHFNLIHNLSNEYQTMAQRRDFYAWLYRELDKKGHDLAWVAMAYFISKKMQLMEVLPFSIFIRKTIKQHARHGSEGVFDEAFGELRKLFVSEIIYKGEQAFQKDKEILRKEQFIWIDDIYKTMDDKSLKTLSHIAKGKGLYGLMVPKSIRFHDRLSDAQSRYNYAVETLRPYCFERYKI
ncbi:Insecticidal toxin complex protein [Hyunsoonleella sp. SJ7]|uniref:Insecticidal toxin complex protein n=1 Tax=Hyunsoonleella aquatilis TaxID=2762758 RepID=A0A923HCY2_9FLAO|nr:Insecticidal toxin complex protein [Hyunsoonleella aquatilis]MBC3757813.1 Insecticidal toxin complex protein [Hyunsoonleella aquatilis]